MDVNLDAGHSSFSFHLVLVEIYVQCCSFGYVTVSTVGGDGAVM